MAHLNKLHSILLLKCCSLVMRLHNFCMTTSLKDFILGFKLLDKAPFKLDDLKFWSESLIKPLVVSLIYVTSFLSIACLSNSEHWSQKTS